MKELIEKMELDLKQLKVAYEAEELSKYENKEHKHFEIGSIVSNGCHTGIVRWTKNEAIGCPYAKGMMGVEILSGNRGFGCFKRDEFNLVNDSYYNTKYHIQLALTGLEIDDIMYSLTRANASTSTTKLIKILESVHIN